MIMFFYIVNVRYLSVTVYFVISILTQVKPKRSESVKGSVDICALSGVYFGCFVTQRKSESNVLGLVYLLTIKSSGHKTMCDYLLCLWTQLILGPRSRKVLDQTHGKWTF